MPSPSPPSCGDALPPPNSTKTSQFPSILAASVLNESAVTGFWAWGKPARDEYQARMQREIDPWWVQHTPLELIRYPWCTAAPPVFRGKHCPFYNDKTAFVRCGSETGANRNATPAFPGQWFHCSQVLRHLRSAALADESLPKPLVFSFGIAKDFLFDDRMALQGDGGYAERLHRLGLSTRTGRPKPKRAEALLFASPSKEAPISTAPTTIALWESGRSIEYRERLGAHAWGWAHEAV